MHFIGIVTCIPGESSLKDNPIIQCLDRLKQLNSNLESQIGDKDCDEAAELFDKLSELCRVEGSGNAAIAVRNGGVELVCSVCSQLPTACESTLDSSLKAMASLLYGIV